MSQNRHMAIVMHCLDEWDGNTDAIIETADTDDIIYEVFKGPTRSEMLELQKENLDELQQRRSITVTVFGDCILSEELQRSLLLSVH